jgi:hypothetical protein
VAFSLSDFERLFPRALRWAQSQEQLILQNGASLDDDQQETARKLGVRAPEQVRVLAVGQLPLPPDAELCAAAQAAGLVAENSLGMTLGYGIFVRDDCLHDRALLAHELVHVAQAERLGFAAFLHQYLLECLELGYHNSPLEQEAVRLSQELR